MTEIRPVQKTADLEDTAIKYLLYEGPEPAMVMLHATGFMPWMWHPIARKLAGSHRIIVPYFCDHRYSDPREGGLSWLQLARDIADLCEILGIASPLLVGHSMGAAVVTLAAGKFGVAAQKMILFEPIFLPSELYSLPLEVEQHPLASKSIKRRNGWEDREAARAYLKSKPLFARWDEEMLDLYLNFGFTDTDQGEITLVCHPEREAAMFMGSMSYDPWPVLPEVPCPVLVLEGAETDHRGIVKFQKAAEMFPQGEHRKVEGAGHLIPMEQPAAATAIIKEFFDGSA